jgi:ribosomal protein S18 acetylase RimI-like enzyme
MSFISITRASREDGDLIASLSRRTFYDAFARFNTAENMDKFMNSHYNPESLSAETADPENIFLLAWLEDICVGYIKLRESENESEKPEGLTGIAVIEILRLYTEQKTIGKGIGKALMESALNIAREKNKKAVWLGVWEHNARAIAFYRKFGFQIFGEHIFMLGDDPQTDLLMKKEI